MRVGVNCICIDPSYVGGLNTYCFGLFNGWSRIAPHCNFNLYITQANAGLFDQFKQFSNFALKIVDSDIGYRQAVWRAVSLTGNRALQRFVGNSLFSRLTATIDEESDIVYVPTVTLLAYNHRKPTAVSMHDIQHVRYPQFFDAARLISRKVTYDSTAKCATYLQASSSFMKQEFLSYFSCLKPEQVEVIPEGVDTAEFSRPRPAGRLAKYSLPEQFLFYPAQLWPHKNHITALKALKHLEREHALRIPLVLTGGEMSAAKSIFSFTAENKMDYVRYLGKVPFDDLVALYQAATWLLMPSLYESNSLPVLEAAAAGTAVIASRIPPNEELGAALCLNLFNPLEDKELAALILRLWDDCQLRKSQAARNRENIETYSWDKVAGRYVAWFSKACA